MTRASFVRKRRGRITCEAEVEIDINDVLEELDDDDLREECRNRGIVLNTQKAESKHEAWRDFIEEIRDTAKAHDTRHMEVLLVRLLAMAGVPRLTTVGLYGAPKPEYGMLAPKPEPAS